MTGEEILKIFYRTIEFKKGKYGWHSKLDIDFYKGKVLNYNILDSNSGKVVLEKGTKITQRSVYEIQKKKINTFCIEEESLIGKFLSCDIINEKNGKIYFEAGYEINEELIAFLNQNKITKYIHLN